LTENHNTFARRHALAEIAGEFQQGARIAQLERATTGYLEHGTVVPLGRVDHEYRFTTRDLLACEQAIVEGAERRQSERTAVVHPRLPDLVMADLPASLSEEQMNAARSIATDGAGVSVLQALAGTGKTRVLGALARIYEVAGYRVVGVAPTGRAARELGDTAGITAFTIHRLLAELDESGGFGPSTVLLLDEAGTAPTRPSAELFARAEQSGAKVIAVGDGGQLPSVGAGGWFAAISEKLGGPELRQVMRQRDPTERETLEALHDGDPEPYLELKRERSELAVYELEDDGFQALLADWNLARLECGLAESVMIARDNGTRAMLNDAARELLVKDGALRGNGVVVADQEFRVGDRVIARRNDRYRDVDNGTLARIADIDSRTGAFKMQTDAGDRRLLDAAYAAEHLEHAYALTGHGALGATVEWVGVIGRPSEFSREWAYTSLSRARGRTRVYVVAEAAASQRQREEYAPPEPERTSDEALKVLNRAMRRREAERLAIEAIEPEHLSTAEVSPASLLPSDLAEGAEDAWRTPGSVPRDSDRDHGFDREM
jgi:ATP-dependent exoDNAse (exonuclease V) alpha subunit